VRRPTRPAAIAFFFINRQDTHKVVQLQGKKNMVEKELRKKKNSGRRFPVLWEKNEAAVLTTHVQLKRRKDHTAKNDISEKFKFHQN